MRFGWCVRQGNLEDVRKVLRLTHTLWGGRYNPIIPIAANTNLADQLIEVFHVDALYAASDDNTLTNFIARFPHLPWPELHRQLFIDGMRGKLATFVDIYHPVRHLFEEFVKDKDIPQISAKVFEWEPDDPLGDMLLATFGSYPTTAEIGKDYRDFVLRNLKAEAVKIAPEMPVPHEVYNVLFPSGICAHRLEWDRAPNRRDPGVYLGSAGSFSDIVNFWNLRASDIELVFYDPIYDGRLRTFKDSWVAKLNERPEDPVGFRNAVAVWQEGNIPLADLNFGPRVLQCAVTDATWNGLNVLPATMHIEEQQSLLASVSSGTPVPSAHFQLPKKQFYDEREFHNQHVVVTVHPYALSGKDEPSFHFPFIPEINEYYGRNAHFRWNVARSQRDGLGIITEVTSNNLHINALPPRQLITKMFEAFGITAVPSQAGLIAGRLIRQMGGLQGCRVFKIRGIRELIEQYGPLQPFTRSGAIQIIGQNDPVTHQPRFEDYESLYIEAREKRKLKPEDAFTYLLKNGVFRVGLNLKCPNCELSFWLSLDEVATETECEYCGTEFNITPLLRDRDWAFRRSGLFGKENHQEGSIPVALTLQQIDTVLSTEHIFATGMSLVPVTALINACETDVVVVAAGYDDKVHLAIGEAKTNDEITEQDVDNLRRVADALQGKRFTTYIIFAKTTSFTPEEVIRCRAAQPEHRRRVILLSDRELEPYFVYERTAKEFEIQASAISLEHFAQATHNIYFEPRRKAVPPV